MHIDHRQFNNIGSGALHRRINCRALSSLTTHTIAGINFRQIQSTTKNRLDEALFRSTVANIIHIVLHPRIAGEVELDIFRCLFAVNTQLTRQAEG